MHAITMRNNDLEVVIDPGYGAEIVGLVDRRTGLDVLFSTSWRERAAEIRQGTRSAVSVDSMGRWMEQYRGGWQTLLPNAGPERVVDGATLGFHGEASQVAWYLVSATDTLVHLTCELFTAPIVVERTVALVGATLTITDRLENTSTADARVDYVQHPAFGGRFLEGSVVIDTGARRFVPHGDSITARLERELAHPWPHYYRPDGVMQDLSAVSAAGSSESTFGSLTDFTGYWASITNRTEGLTVRMDWDGEAMPFAWFWQELNGTTAWPWFARARVIAIEPSSTPTDGPDRESAMVVPAISSRIVWVRISLSDPEERDD